MSSLKDFSSVAPTFIASVPLKKSPKFLFVTINNPDEIKVPTKQSNIRRHAKKDADRARKTRQHPQFKSMVVETHFNQAGVSPPGVRYNPDTERLLGEQQTQQANAEYLSSERPSIAENNNSSEGLHDESSYLAFLRPFGAGRGLNPFAPYPVEPNSRTVQLLDYSRHVAERRQHPMRAIWITIGMSDSSAFNLTLSSSSLLISQESNQAVGETTESMKYYTAAVHAVSKRLQDPVDSTSDGVFGTILGFACLDNTIGNWERWQLHMSGLERILQIRGGIESLPTSHILQVTAFWVDITGSLVLDTIPRFPIPDCVGVALELHYSLRIFAFFQEWNIKFPDLSDIRDGLTSLASLIDYFNNQKAKNVLWQGELFVPLFVHPVAHQLLSMPRYAIAADAIISSGLVIREILRLTSLLFIGLLKEHCHVFPSGVSQNKLRLTWLLTEVAVDWSSFMDLRLWVLVLSALTEVGDRSWYVSEIAGTVAFLGLARWDDVLKLLKELIWIDEILDGAADALGNEVDDFRVTLVSEVSNS